MYTPCSTEISRPLTVYLHGSAEACLILMARKAHLKHTADGSEIPYNHLGCIEHYKTLEIMADNLPTSTGAGFLNHQQYFLISLLVMLPLTLPWNGRGLRDLCLGTWSTFWPFLGDGCDGEDGEGEWSRLVVVWNMILCLNPTWWVKMSQSDYGPGGHIGAGFPQRQRLNLLQDMKPMRGWLAVLHLHRMESPCAVTARPNRRSQV